MQTPILQFHYKVATISVKYNLSLHDALPIYTGIDWIDGQRPDRRHITWRADPLPLCPAIVAYEQARIPAGENRMRSEEHTSELQSRRDLVCRLLLERKNTISRTTACSRTSFA